MPWPDPVVLTGDHAKLEPLQREHHDGLIEAVRDGELWKLWYTDVPKPDRMGAEIERRLGLQAAGSMLPFAVRNRASGKIVGMTTFMNIDAQQQPRRDRLDLVRAIACSAATLNTECKLMLLAHAFEKLDCIAVEFRTALLQPSEPARDRAARREAGRHPAQPSALCQRQRCAIPWCSRSSPANGRRCARTWAINSAGDASYTSNPCARSSRARPSAPTK